MFLNEGHAAAYQQRALRPPSAEKPGRSYEDTLLRTSGLHSPQLPHLFACIACLANHVRSGFLLESWWLSISVFPTRKLNVWRCANTQSIYTLRRSLGLSSVNTESIYSMRRSLQIPNLQNPELHLVDPSPQDSNRTAHYR